MSSRDRLIPFTINFRMSGNVRWTPSEWRVRATKHSPAHGKPSPAAIAAYVAVMEASMAPGGPNSHLQGPMGADKILSAWIIDQRTGDVVATWTRG